jgi:ABC-type sugar transport system ATPase subunit
MEEIFEISDRIVVLRDGMIVGDKNTHQWTQSDLVKCMVGRDLKTLFPEKKHQSQSEIILSAKDIRIFRNGEAYIGPLSFELRRGEILGIGGLLGSGRTELLKALYGAIGFEVQGDVRVRNQTWASESPQKALSGQVVYLSEDRKRESVLKKRSIHENLRISDSSLKGLFSLVKNKTESARTSERLHSLKVKYHKSEQDILSLSGGNQQKVILGRVLEVAPDIIMLDEPTRGVDVGAKFEIYQILFELVEAGKSLIVVSSELPELLGLCDRVLVLREGKHMGTLDSHELTPESVMSRAFGLRESTI